MADTPTQPAPARPRPPMPAPAGAAAPQEVAAAIDAVAAVTGCTLVDDAYGRSSRPLSPPADAALLSGGFVAPLTDWSLLTASGADAASFLHSQLTNDVDKLAPGVARLAGYCTPKGRLLATFVVWRDGDAIRLATAQPQAAAVRKRLAMFVLRAKAVLHDDGARFALVGAAGEAGAAALRALGLEPPPPSGTAGTSGTAEAADIVAVGLPSARTANGELRRWLIAMPLAALAAAWPLLSQAAPVAGSALWRHAEVLSGVPRIVAGAVERFVPQMINFELAGGVDFRKGCYPGQEVVARSQYLGKLRRRTFAARVDAPEPPPGADVLADGAREPVGQVVIAAPDPAGGTVLLFEAPIDAVRDGARLRLSPQDAAPLELLELPYALPASSRAPA